MASRSISFDKDSSLRDPEEQDERKPKHYFRLVEKDGKAISKRRFCSLCWEMQRGFSYGEQTSETNFTAHLSKVHGIDLKKVNPNKQKKIDEIFLGKPVVRDRTQQDRKFTLGRELVLFLAVDLKPFSLVDCNGFQRFLIRTKVVNSKEEIPHSSTLSRSCLDDMYQSMKEKVKERIKNGLQGVNNAAITTDGWTDSYNRNSYLTITVHFINKDMELISLTLKTFTFDGQHTARNISREIKQVLEEFDLMTKTLTFVTDGGSNFVKAVVDELQCPRQPCIAHSLHRLINHDLMKHESQEALKDLTDKIRRANRALTYKKRDMEKEFEDAEAAKKWERLMEVAAKLDAEGDADETIGEFDLVASEPTVRLQRLKSMTETRWSSMLEMLRTYLAHEVSFDARSFSETYRDMLQRMSKYELIIDSDDLDHLSEAVKILEVFAEATNMLEGQQYTTSSLALLIYLKIKETLQESSTCTDTDKGAKMKEVLLENLDKRFQVTDQMILSAILDPSVHTAQKVIDYLTERNISQSDLLTDKIKQIKPPSVTIQEEDSNSQSLQPEARATESVSSRMMLLKSFKKGSALNNNKESGLLDEFAIFRSVDEDVNDPLKWWREKGGTFPTLRLLARETLCVPMTSAPSERNFSSAGSVITAKRSRLHPSTVTKVLLIHDNYRRLFPNELN